MEPTTPHRLERSDLASMMATLYSYESWLGPYHPQTLRLMARLALAFWGLGDAAGARPLLERAAADYRRCLNGICDERLEVLGALKRLLIDEGDYERAGAVQKEIWECTTGRLGADHPDALASRADLADILMTTAEGMSDREIQ